MKGSRIKLHPLFLLWGATFYWTGSVHLLWEILLCWGIQEGGQALFSRACGMSLQRVLFTPVGIRIEVEEEGASFETGLLLRLVGSIVGIFLSVCFFALEYRAAAMLSLLLAAFRLLPILPLAGGRLWLDLLGRWKGTLRAAAWLTKMGMGLGWGITAFGILYAVLYPRAYFFICTGLYFLYANKREFTYIARRLYLGMLHETEKPLKAVQVSGKESPLQLALLLNPFEEIFFLRQDAGGVSQERVMLALFSGKDARWLWRTAENKDFRANCEKFGYDDTVRKQTAMEK